MSIVNRKLRVLVFALPLLMIGDTLYSSPSVPEQNGRRIRFRIAAIEETAGTLKTISQTIVEGPAGTDFNINLHGGRFQMNAKFLTDLVAPDTLKMRANLNTRRFYGYSEKDLPLYEEDAQAQVLLLGFDEKLVLLPFGRNGNTDQLKIEITPTIGEQGNQLASDKTRSIDIKIPQASPGGAISVQATKIPHNYVVEGSLVEDGKVLARGSANYLLEEPGELLLQPEPQANSSLTAYPLRLSLTIDQYLGNGPGAQVGFTFSVFREARRGWQTILSEAAGITIPGSEVNYELGELPATPAARKYELRLKVTLAPGEKTN